MSAEKMTKELHLKLVEAFWEGKLEKNIGAMFEPNWKLADDVPSKHAILNNWRIRPTPKLRPWKAEEVPVGALMRRKGHDRTRALIVGLDYVGDEIDAGVLWSGRHKTWLSESYEVCLRENEHSTDGGRTWLPCGVEEVEQ